MKILLVEDDKRVAELVKRGLEEDTNTEYVVTNTYDGSSGKKMALNQDFELIISDIMLPEIDGITLCKSLKKLKPNTPIILLTALGTTDDKVDGFDAGADDYLVKPFEIRELLVRIRAIMKRFSESKDQNAVLSYGGIELDTAKRTVVRDGQAITLTPKEFNLLAYMMKNPERVLSRNEISEKVWETHFDTGTNFIDVYINYLRKKIDKPFTTKLIHTKPGIGFILEVNDEN